MENKKIISYRRFQLAQSALNKLTNTLFGYGTVDITLKEGDLSFKEEGPIKVEVSWWTAGNDKTIEHAEQFSNQLKIALRIAKAFPYSGYYYK